MRSTYYIILNNDEKPIKLITGLTTGPRISITDDPNKFIYYESLAEASDFIHIAKLNYNFGSNLKIGILTLTLDVLDQ